MRPAHRSAPKSATKAFVELQWGLYLFVPALPALRRLADFRSAPLPAPAAMPVPVAEIDRWRARLEDRDNGRATWKEVREQPAASYDAPHYGRLVGTAAGVFDALADAKCAKVSVRGFGERMEEPAWASTTWAWIRPMATRPSATWSTR